MTARRCCQASTATARDRLADRGTVTGRCLALTGWIIPGTILAILPKCPACLAAYIALGTGLGLSLSVATWLHTSLILVSVALLAVAVMRFWRSRNLSILPASRRHPSGRV